MNLRQLKYFLAVAQAGNMTRAAEQLHVAQPALGMQIRLLEEDLGVPLLVRHSRGVEATAAGALLQARALALLKLLDEIRSEVSALGGQDTEHIRLGLTPSLMHLLASDLLMAVRERLPQVLLSVVEEMSHVQVDALLRQEIDLALAYDVPEVPSLARRPLHEEDLMLVALPSGHVGLPIRFSEVVAAPLALPEAGDAVRDRVARAARELGLELKVAFEVRSVSAIRELVFRGAAVGVLPLAAVIDDVRSGKLDARPIASPAVRRTLYLASHRQHPPLRHEAALEQVVRDALDHARLSLGSLACHWKAPPPPAA